MQIRYSERVEETKLLGPGSRAVLWVYGCCFHCPGCIALNFRYGEYAVARPEELADWFLNTPADGLTISGGEPMLQGGALADMVDIIRRKRDIGVIVYTGFTYEQLLVKSRQDDGVRRFLGVIDILIDGPYLQEDDNNEPYRGSANQKIIQLTSRYEGQADSYYYSHKGREVEVRISGKKTLMVGVPGKDQAAIWAKIKKLSCTDGDGLE